MFHRGERVVHAGITEMQDAERIMTFADRSTRAWSDIGAESNVLEADGSEEHHADAVDEEDNDEWPEEPLVDEAPGDADVTPLEVYRATMEASLRFGNRRTISSAELEERRRHRRHLGILNARRASRRLTYDSFRAPRRSSSAAPSITEKNEPPSDDGSTCPRRRRRPSPKLARHDRRALEERRLVVGAPAPEG